jgi:hypothetical protein
LSQKIELQIAIDPEGNVRIETHGLKGEECMVETASLEKQLGTAGERSKKAEYYSKSAKTGARSAQR